jgi:hypothetical protein
VRDHAGDRALLVLGRLLVVGALLRRRLREVVVLGEQLVAVAQSFLRRRDPGLRRALSRERLERLLLLVPQQRDRSAVVVFELDLLRAEGDVLGADALVEGLGLFGRARAFAALSSSTSASRAAVASCCTTASFSSASAYSPSSSYELCDGVRRTKSSSLCCSTDDGRDDERDDERLMIEKVVRRNTCLNEHATRVGRARKAGPLCTFCHSY